MSGVLNTITKLITVARDTYIRDYSSKNEFVSYYMERETGFLKVLNEEKLAFPIQFEEEGDFYFFDNETALVAYVVAVLENDGTIDSESDYYSSSEFESSGC